MYAQLDSLRTIIIARPGHPARTRHDIISAISDTPHPSRDTVVHGAAAPHTSPHIARVVEHAGTRPQIAYPALDASTRAHNPAPAHATDRTCPCYNDQAPRRYDAVRSPAGRVVRPRSYGAANHSPGGGGDGEALGSSSGTAAASLAAYEPAVVGFPQAHRSPPETPPRC